MTSDTRPQPNSETKKDDEAERTESSSASKEHKRPENEHECPESENEQHGRNAPDDQDDDIGCI
jgi:hypothetical protein